MRGIIVCHVSAVSRGPLYKHHAETLEVAHKAAATKLAQLEVFIDEQTSMIAQHKAPAPGVRPWDIKLEGPPGMLFEAIPEAFWLLDSTKLVLPGRLRTLPRGHAFPAMHRIGVPRER